LAAGRSGEYARRVDAALDAVGGSPAKREAARDGRRSSAGPNARERRRISNAVVRRRRLLLRVSNALAEMVTCASYAVRHSPLCARQSVCGIVQRSFKDARIRLFDQGDRDESRHLLAPKI
jgi:hypothetical protein